MCLLKLMMAGSEGLRCVHCRRSSMVQLCSRILGQTRTLRLWTRSQLPLVCCWSSLMRTGAACMLPCNVAFMCLPCLYQRAF